MVFFAAGLRAGAFLAGAGDGLASALTVLGAGLAGAGLAADFGSALTV